MEYVRAMTLREFAEKMRPAFPEIEWVTFDGTNIRCFTATKKPSYVCGQWSGGKSVLNAPIAKSRVKCPEAHRKHGAPDYSCAIWGFKDFLERLQSETESKAKYVSQKKGVIAFCADGSNIFFETFKECKSFYGLRSVSDVRDAIDNGKPMPDGSTFIDEATDEEFLQKLFSVR